jgi:hypothetical protein
MGFCFATKNTQNVRAKRKELETGAKNREKKMHRTG